MSNDQRPCNVELFLDTDAPQRDHGQAGCKPDQSEREISEEHGEAGEELPTDLKYRKEPGRGEARGEEAKVQRPDSQDSSSVKRTHVEPPETLFLAHQKFRDEIGAEGEKQIHSETADVGYHVAVAHFVNDVTHEHPEKGEKTEAVQFRDIETRRFRLRSRGI